MIGWIWRVLVGRFSRCDHSWKTESDKRLTDGMGGIGHRIHLRCALCGDWRKRDLI
jgi:hypothetical protein